MMYIQLIFTKNYNLITMIEIRKNHYSFLLPIALIFLFVAGTALWHQMQIIRADRAKIDAIADAMASKHGVRPELVKAIIWKESRYRVNSVGKAGEIGLMQIYTPAVKEWSRRTGKAVPLRLQLFNPETNIDIGTWYLKWAGSHWEGYKSALLLQISEYNAGYGNVTDVVNGWKPKTPQDEVTLEQITIPGTRKYVRDVLRRMEALSAK